MKLHLSALLWGKFFKFLACLVPKIPIFPSLCLFHLSRHTTRCQTQRGIWNLSTPPLSVNSHSLTFTSRHSSCGPNKVTPQACVACSLLGNVFTQCQLKMSKVVALIVKKVERFWWAKVYWNGNIVLWSMQHSWLIFTCRNLSSDRQPLAPPWGKE